MGWISNLIAGRSRNVQIGAVLVVSIILIIGPYRVDFAVSEALLGTIYYPFFKIRHAVDELVEVAEENRRLRAALVEASERISSLEEVQRENERLRAVLGFELAPEYELLPASVVAVHGTSRPVAVVINRGTRDTVLSDMPVINQQGLVGRIKSVSTNFSTVQLLTDPTNRVAARVAESREMGIVRYLTGEGMILSNFPIDGVIKEGDMIVSSGLGGIYPPGMDVGTVTFVRRPAEEPFCEVRLQPAVNFHSVEEVFIMRRLEQ